MTETKYMKKYLEDGMDAIARISNHVLFKEKSALKEAIRETGYHKFLPKDFDIRKIFDNEEDIKKVITICS